MQDGFHDLDRRWIGKIMKNRPNSSRFRKLVCLLHFKSGVYEFILEVKALGI